MTTILQEPFVLTTLKAFTSSELAALNTYARLFRQEQRWNGWIDEMLSQLLMVPGGLRLELAQSSETTGEQTQNYRFDQSEISIGRVSENDITLPLNAISRRHARIFQHEDSYYIEDLKSGTGTYLNRRKLSAGRPQKLVNGDEFSIFPYVFRVKVEELWRTDEAVRVLYHSRLTAVDAAGFTSSAQSDVYLVQLEVSPGGRTVFLTLSRAFMEILTARLMRAKTSGLVEDDLGLVEFVVVSILERANRELRFPFQFSLSKPSHSTVPSEPGLLLQATVHLTGASGEIQALFPVSCLRELQKSPEANRRTELSSQLAWTLSVCGGVVEMTVDDLAELEQGDILLYKAEYELILPWMAGERSAERGWSAERIEGEIQGLRAKSYFERIPSMESGEKVQAEQVGPTKPELGGLPVRMQVIISHVELSLGELEALSAGTVIELGLEKTSKVQLAVNGKLLGSGDLVDVDGQLGVQISAWSGS